MCEEVEYTYLHALVKSSQGIVEGIHFSQSEIVTQVGTEAGWWMHVTDTSYCSDVHFSEVAHLVAVLTTGVYVGRSKQTDLRTYLQTESVVEQVLQQYRYVNVGHSCSGGHIFPGGTVHPGDNGSLCGEHYLRLDSPAWMKVKMGNETGMDARYGTVLRMITVTHGVQVQAAFYPEIVSLCAHCARSTQNGKC